MYIRIMNPGVAPLESFTTLGLSTSADNNAKGIIGQFGSGNKHAINLLLRNKCDIQVYLGDTHLQFGSSLKTVHAPDGSHVYDQATILVDGVEEELGYTLTFGKFDWNDITMAMREFISNAIDMTIKLHGTYQHEDLQIKTVAEPRPVPGKTCVFVHADDALMEYVRDLGKFFLHFSDTPLWSDRIHQKLNSFCRVYREGVFVREVDSISLFSYNFKADEIEIDECRNLDRYKIESLLETVLASSYTEDEACAVLEVVKNQDCCFETKVLGDCYNLMYSKNDVWIAALEKTFGLDDVFVPQNPFIMQRVIEEGYTPIPVTSGVLKVLTRQGGQTFKTILDAASQIEYEIVDNDDTFIADEVWAYFQYLEMTHKKDQPRVQYFKDIDTDHGAKKLGFVKEDIVFINDCLLGESSLLRRTIVEEYIHYISGNSDCSRGFQSFACETIASGMEKQK